jgi:hypothetical protein
MQIERSLIFEESLIEKHSRRESISRRFELKKTSNVHNGLIELSSHQDQQENGFTREGKYLFIATFFLSFE